MATEVYAPVEFYSNRQWSTHTDMLTKYSNCQWSMYDTEPLHVAITRWVLLQSSDLLIKPKRVGFISIILHHVYGLAVE